MKKTKKPQSVCFHPETAGQILSKLDKMPKRQRKSAVDQLIFKKRTRPVDIGEQFELLWALSQDGRLTRYDATYALIACSHKACELIDQAALARVMPLLRQALSGSGDLRNELKLRASRTHLVFSLLNVSFNVDLLLGGAHKDELAAHCIDELQALNPRQQTPYLFNTASNLSRCCACAALIQPENLSLIVDLHQRLLSLAIEMNNPIYWRFYAWFFLSKKLEKVDKRTSFGEFQKAFHRLSTLEQLLVCDAEDARQRLLARVVDLSFSGRNADQRQAIEDAVCKTILIPAGWTRDENRRSG